MPKSRPVRNTIRKRTNINNETGNRTNLISAINNLGYDGELFCQGLEMSTKVHKLRRGQPDKKIRFYHYASWANTLKHNDVNLPEESCGYGFPKVVLEFTRDILPENVAREIRQDAFLIDLEIFCKYIIW